MKVGVCNNCDRIYDDKTSKPQESKENHLGNIASNSDAIVIAIKKHIAEQDDLIKQQKEQIEELREAGELLSSAIAKHSHLLNGVNVVELKDIESCCLLLDSVLDSAALAPQKTDTLTEPLFMKNTSEQD
jgi:predicted ribosome quality control (RQC) complex YloA/Tae2 family protein